MGKLLLGQALPKAQAANGAALMQARKDLLQGDGLVLSPQDGGYGCLNFADFIVGEPMASTDFSKVFGNLLLRGF